MKPLSAVDRTPIFAHEQTTLYARIRGLHAFAAELEIAAGASRYFGTLVHIGLLAMLTTASAGVAPTERTRARHLRKLRDQLARFASALRSMADRGLLSSDSALAGMDLVRDANLLIDDFGDALLRSEPSGSHVDQSAEDDVRSTNVPSFQDESVSDSGSAPRASRGARRVRHVEATAPGHPTTVPSRASQPRSESNAAQIAATAAAHNDERIVPESAARLRRRRP